MGDETPNILKLPATLDLNAATGMHEQLMGMKGNAVEVDASDVRKTGAQCIQVLVAAKKTWDADGEKIEVGAMSDAFANTLKLLGISGDELPLKETA